MTIANETIRAGPYTTDGSATVFAFGFRIFADSDLEAWYKATGGSWVQLTLNSNYTVAGRKGGSITTIGASSPYPAGELLIISSISATQDSNYTSGEALPEENLESDLDLRAIIDIQNKDEIARALKFEKASATKNIDLPEMTANYYLRANAVGDGVEWAPGINVDTVRCATLIVAASDASALSKARADYVCDGTDDQVQIQAAIDALADADKEGVVYLTRGVFYISSAIAMRDYVALESTDCVHGTRILIADGSNCHGIELAMKDGDGASHITGIYVEGNKDNNTGGTGFMMPRNGLRCTNSGADCAAATVEVTSTQIIFKRDGTPDYTITLSDTPGTLISEIIDVVNGNNGWTVTNITGGLPGAKDTLDCTTTPSEALKVKAETDAYTVNVDLTLGGIYDLFFHRCMSLHADDYGFYIFCGQSPQLNQCIAEYAGKDGFYIGAYCSNFRMYGCYGAYNIGNGYNLRAAHSQITSCRANNNTGHGFFLYRNASLIGCFAGNHDETNMAGIYIDLQCEGATVGQCRVMTNYEGIKIVGLYNTISGCFIYTNTHFGIYLLGSGDHNTIVGNVIRNNTNYGIYSTGDQNIFSGNVFKGNKESGVQHYDSSTNIWMGNLPKFAGAILTTNKTLLATATPGTYIGKKTDGAVTFTLPAAILGLEYTFVVGVEGQECRIDPDGTETIAIGGVQQGAGEYITANAIYETITLRCITPGQWEDYYKAGTWTAEP